MKRKAILHPFLFTIYGVLSLIANNITEVDLFALQTLFFSTVACILVLLFFRIVFKDIRQASLISSGAIILIFTYGHAKTFLQSKPNFNSAIWSYMLIIIWWALFIADIYLVLKVLKNYEVATDYFFSVGLILNIFPIISFVKYSIQTTTVEKNIQTFLATSYEQQAVPVPESELTVEGDLPDIYYIILDAYSRSDVLAEVYGYDNSNFEEQLNERGFYIATESNSNYHKTVQSLGSSLNMMHINTASEYVSKNVGVNREWALSRIMSYTLHHNRLMDILKQQGYTLISYDSGFEVVSFPAVDQNLMAPAIQQSNYQAKNMFELFFLDTFVENIYLWFRPEQQTKLASIYDAHRERLTFTFNSIPEFASKEGDYFVFAHLVAPHPPFVFGPNGEPIEGSGAFTLADTNITNRKYDLYLDEIRYINTLTIKLVDQILADSDTPPIIIIQADHGSRIFPDKESISELKNKLYFPILNAYYLPGIDIKNSLYPSISPVNSFRIVLNQYFGTNMDMLPDESYLWEAETDYDFFLVQP